MSLSVAILSAALVAAAPTAGADRVATRCRPAPYYIAGRDPQPVAARLGDQPKANRLRTDERRTNPCYLVGSPRVAVTRAGGIA